MCYSAHTMYCLRIWKRIRLMTATPNIIGCIVAERSGASNHTL